MNVINGIRNSRKPTLETYRRILADLTERYSTEPILDDRDGLKKFIYTAVQYVRKISINEIEGTELDSLFQLLDTVTQFMACMTPVEFTQTFPAEKEYDGKRYESKDYFTTMAALKEYPSNEMIGEGVMEFLWAYHNMDICRFEVCRMMCISRMRQLEGQLGLMEQFFSDQGKPLTTYYKEGDYLINGDTGAATKISKPKKRRPKYLRVVGN